MNTNLRIMLVGRICGEDFDWTIAPPPVDDEIDAFVAATYADYVPQVSSNDPDARFDAPPTFDFFEHLVGCCKAKDEPVVQTDANLLVSSYMNRNGFLDMQSNYYLDGWHAATEGQPLAAMPTEYHETGWWSANMTRGEAATEQQDDRDDIEFWRNHCN